MFLNILNILIKYIELKFKKDLNKLKSFKINVYPSTLQDVQLDVSILNFICE